MSIFKRGGNVKRRSLGRAVMLAGVVIPALMWSGFVPPLSQWAWGLDMRLRDQLSLILEPTKEREDLVFLGINEEWRMRGKVDPVALQQSRALQLMRQNVGNHQLDRRIYAELIEKLAAAGAKVIIFDVLFVGPSGDVDADREFAEALSKHRDKIVLSAMFQPAAVGYERLSSVEQLPMLNTAPGQRPHEGYVNMWPDAEDGVVRRMVYTTTMVELESGAQWPTDEVYDSLSALTARLLGAKVIEGQSPRLRYAVASEEGRSGFAEAYAPHNLHDVFIPMNWDEEFAGGEFFRDKVVLISTSTKADGDYHPIPGAIIFGGQFHLQALGCLLEDSFWKPVPQWVETLSLLVMAVLAVLIGIAFRNPLTILLTALALGGGFLVACAWISGLTGVLFVGTPGIIGLVTVTICAEIGQLVGRSGETETERASGAAPSPATP